MRLSQCPRTGVECEPSGHEADLSRADVLNDKPASLYKEVIREQVERLCAFIIEGIHWLWVGWCTPVMPALSKQRQENPKVEVSLGIESSRPTQAYRRLFLIKANQSNNNINGKTFQFICNYKEHTLVTFADNINLEGITYTLENRIQVQPPKPISTQMLWHVFPPNKEILKNWR